MEINIESHLWLVFSPTSPLSFHSEQPAAHYVILTAGFRRGQNIFIAKHDLREGFGRQKSLGPHTKLKPVPCHNSSHLLPSLSGTRGFRKLPDFHIPRASLFVLTQGLSTQPHRCPSSKVRTPAKWRAGGGKSTNSSSAQILALAGPQQAPAAQLIKFVTNTILNSFIKGRFYFIEKNKKIKKPKRLSLELIKLSPQAAMSLNADFECFICYLISPFSSLLPNILTLFHLSHSWAKHRSPDTGKVFNLPLKLPGVLSLQFSN